MKSRYKIVIIIPCIIITIGFLFPIVLSPTCEVLGLQENEICGPGILYYFGIPIIINPVSFEYWLNPQNSMSDECWYDDGNGNMLPCIIETGPILWDPFYPTELDCDGICIDDETNFDNKTIRVEGKIADEICAIIGGECPPYYPGNLQDGNSIMVGFVISDQEKIKHYQFFIKNNTLSYNVTINEN